MNIPEPASQTASSPLRKILVVLVIIAVMVGGFLIYNFWNDQQKTKLASAEEKARIEAEKANAMTLNGEVFIVTQGGVNYKLGLVHIEVVSQDDLLQLEATATSELSRLGLRIKTTTEKLRWKIQQKLGEIDTIDFGADETTAQIFRREFKAWIHDYEGILNDFPHGEIRERFRGEITDKFHETMWTSGYGAAYQTLLSLHDEERGAMLKRDSAGFYFEPTLSPYRSTKTNADGQFQIEIPRTGSYFLMAHASRHISEKTEEYYWLLPVEGQGKSPRNVMLSNDSLFESGMKLSDVQKI